MCDELMSPLLPLFQPCPNAVNNVGQNQHVWVPLPRLPLTPELLRMYQFVGRLVGLALRTRNLLALNLPSVFWKMATRDEITPRDVLAVDMLAFRTIDMIKTLEAQPHMTPQRFERKMMDLRFTATGSDRKSYELMPGGAHTRVTWHNRHLYMDLLLQFRLNEYRPACEAMLQGLLTVVPAHALALMHWTDVQREVCGVPDLNVDLLEENTLYASCSASDPHIRNLWEILRNRFNNRERARFLEFVWGRSRLPTRREHFDRKFQITLYRTDRPDDYLPVTHTCFFSMELPRYSTLEVMHQKLLYAINHCVSIDMDGGGVRMRPAVAVDRESELLAREYALVWRA
jgi:hypothetical protein